MGDCGSILGKSPIDASAQLVGLFDNLRGGSELNKYVGVCNMLSKFRRTCFSEISRLF